MRIADRVGLTLQHGDRLLERLHDVDLGTTDDAVMVFDCLKEQVEEIDAGTATFTDCNCTLCGEDCPLAEARTIIAAGEPELLDAEEDEFDEDEDED